MKEIEAKDGDINIYGTNANDNIVIKIEGINLNKLDLDITSEHEFVVMEYQDQYAVFTNFFISDIMGNNTYANIACEYDEEMWFEKKPDKEDIALKMI